MHNSLDLVEEVLEEIKNNNKFYIIGEENIKSLLQDSFLTSFDGEIIQYSIVAKRNKIKRIGSLKNLKMIESINNKLYLSYKTDCFGKGRRDLYPSDELALLPNALYINSKKDNSKQTSQTLYIALEK